MVKEVSYECLEGEWVLEDREDIEEVNALMVNRSIDYPHSLLLANE